jgi:hypothetical protein
MINTLQSIITAVKSHEVNNRRDAVLCVCVCVCVCVCFFVCVSTCSVRWVHIVPEGMRIIHVGCEGKNWNCRHRVLVNTCAHMNETEGNAGGFAERPTQVSRALVRTPGITGVGREINACGTQFRDCDYIRGVGRRSMIIYFQRRNLIVGKTDLNIISMWKQWWHGLINTEHHLL